MVKIDQNWSEVIMLVKNGQRVKICQKIAKIAKKWKKRATKKIGGKVLEKNNKKKEKGKGKGKESHQMS